MASAEVHGVSVWCCKPQAGVPGACEVAGAACNERDSQGLPEDRQAAALPEAVHQRRHPGIVAHRAPQVPAHARTAVVVFQGCTGITMPPAYA